MISGRKQLYYESNESEDSFVSDYNSYDDELDDSSEEMDEENVEIDDEMSVELHKRVNGFRRR